MAFSSAPHGELANKDCLALSQLSAEEQTEFLEACDAKEEAAGQEQLHAAEENVKDFERCTSSLPGCEEGKRDDWLFEAAECTRFNFGNFGL